MSDTLFELISGIESSDGCVTNTVSAALTRRAWIGSFKPANTAASRKPDD